MQTIATGWHGCERVSVQAISGELVLVRYPERERLSPRPMYDPVRRWYLMRPAIEPWAWLPISDIDIDDEEGTR